MYLEGICVCVGYSDILAATLANNLPHLDHLVIVTDHADWRTHELCAFYNAGYKITLVKTEAFYENGDAFNKGRAINEGMKHLRMGDWVVHFDADIWFSPHLRMVLENRHLDHGTVYGIDRLMCHSYNAWANFLAAPKPINEHYYQVHADAFPMGTRVAHYNQPNGYFPIGYFQLWHPQSSGVKHYPAECPGADRTDLLFAELFPRGQRHLIPETFVIHLDSEKSEKGANWNGRQTVPFLPKVCDSCLCIPVIPAPLPVPIPAPIPSPVPEPPRGYTYAPPPSPSPLGKEDALAVGLLVSITLLIAFAFLS
jgi:hypothetical protein